MDARLAVAIQAAVLASEYCELIRLSSRYQVTSKQDDTPVTVADIGSQLIINHLIKSSFPEDMIVGEEDESSLSSCDLSFLDQFLAEKGLALAVSKAELLSREDVPCGASQPRFWTVDPVDGTAGFLRGGSGQYCICCAYIDEQGHPLLSVVSAPKLHSTGVIMYAVKGEGCFQSALGDISWTRCGEDRNSISDTMCCSFESKHSNHALIERIAACLGLSTLRIDSQVKCMLVAMGTCRLYLRAPHAGYREKVWDHAPGELLITEAGGVVCDQHGNRIVYPAGGLISGAMSQIIATRDRAVAEEVVKLLGA